MADLNNLILKIWRRISAGINSWYCGLRRRRNCLSPRVRSRALHYSIAVLYCVCIVWYHRVKKIYRLHSDIGAILLLNSDIYIFLCCLEPHMDMVMQVVVRCPLCRSSFPSLIFSVRGEGTLGVKVRIFIKHWYIKTRFKLILEEFELFWYIKQ